MRLESLLSPIGIAIFIATILSVVVVYLFVKLVIYRRWLSGFSKQRGQILLCAVAFIFVLAFPMTWFVGFILGGDWVGMFIGSFAEQLGFPVNAAVVMGIGGGIFICLTVLSLAVVSATALAMWFIGRLFWGRSVS